MESVQWEPSCSMQTDGHTDITKLALALSNSANAPKIGGAVKVHVCKHKTVHV